MTDRHYADRLQLIADQLAVHFPAATLTVEYPGFILLTFPGEGEDDRCYAIGTANLTWAADYFRSVKAYENGLTPDGGLDSRVNGNNNDPWFVALQVAAAIARFELEN